MAVEMEKRGRKAPDGQVTAVLHTGPIDSALRAVEASILADGE